MEVVEIEGEMGEKWWKFEGSGDEKTFSLSHKSSSLNRRKSLPPLAT